MLRINNKPVFASEELRRRPWSMVSPMSLLLAVAGWVILGAAVLVLLR